MDFTTLKKEQQIDIYIPSTKSYHHVKLLDVQDNTILVRDSDLSEGQEPDKNLNVGKIYLMYIGKDKNVYCGKTRLIEAADAGEGVTRYTLEKPEQLAPQERRIGTRVTYPKEILYRLEESDSKDFNKTAQAIDLSRGGMGLLITDYYPPDTVLVLKLQIESIEICAKARINWIKQKNNKHIIGISFINLFLPI